MSKTLYTVFTLAAIALPNPFKPLALVGLLLLNGVSWANGNRPNPDPNLLWSWLAFLACGLASTVASPIPELSFWGLQFWGDGWLYWLVLGLTVLTLPNTPAVQTGVIRGVVLGGLVAAVLTFANPAGFYAHAGHNAYVLGLVGVMGWGWQTVLLLAALVVTQSRAALLAWVLVSVVPYMGKQKWLIVPVLAAAGFILWISLGKYVGNDHGQTWFDHLNSNRTHLWQSAWNGWLERPWQGWGFEGLGIRYLVRGVKLYSAKAHNVVLDSLVSLGVPGAFAYGLLLFHTLKRLPKRVWGYHLIVMALWYDSAQYSHLVFLLSGVYFKGGSQKANVKSQEETFAF